MNKKPDVFVAKTLSLGRITIPEEMRTLWHIKEDDFIELQIISVNKAVKAQKGVHQID